MNRYKHPAMLYCYTGWRCPNYSAPILSHFAVFPWYFTTSIKSCMSWNLRCLIFSPHTWGSAQQETLKKLKESLHTLHLGLGKDIQWSYKQKISEGRTDCLGLFEHLKVVLIFQRKVDFPLNLSFLGNFWFCGCWQVPRMKGTIFLNCASLAEASFSHGWHFSEWRSNARSAWCGTMWPQSTRAGI